MNTPVIFVLDVPSAECTDFASLARVVAARLEASGCVRPSWCEAVVRREERFPTGLPLEPPVAIPHADGEHTVKDGFVLARLAEPLAFGAMGDADATPLDVRLAVFIAAGAGTSQVEALEKLLGVLGDENQRNRLEVGSPEEARRTLDMLLNA